MRLVSRRQCQYPILLKARSTICVRFYIFAIFYYHFTHTLCLKRAQKADISIQFSFWNKSPQYSASVRLGCTRIQTYFSSSETENTSWYSARHSRHVASAFVYVATIRLGRVKRDQRGQLPTGCRR